MHIGTFMCVQCIWISSVNMLFILLSHTPSVTVSLVSIEGTDCRIMELGQVADKTGGEVGLENIKCPDL